MQKNLAEIIQVFIGVILASIGLKAFLLPNGFLDGGATGIAILIKEIYNVNISITILLVSLPFFVLAWFTISKKVVIKSIFSILLLVIIIHFENFTSITTDKLLIAIFGGLFLGAGIGLAIKNGAVLDGSEILGIFINQQFGISIGRVILLFNCVLFVITALILSTEVAMYSILTFLITAKVIDFTIKGFEDYVGLMIISEKGAFLEEQLTKQIGIGITNYATLRGSGKSGKIKNQNAIHTVINRIDIKRTYNLIEKIDESAFIIEFDVNNVQGGKLKKYFTKAD